MLIDRGEHVLSELIPASTRAMRAARRCSRSTHGPFICNQQRCEAAAAAEVVPWSPVQLHAMSGDIMSCIATEDSA